MSTVFDFFDIIYCVNLPRDTDRKELASQQFKKLGILDKVTWISSEPPNPQYKSTNYHYAGEFGCSLSHLKVLTNALTHDVINGILVIEDDPMFYDKVEHLSVAIDELPDDWDVMYIGGNPVSAAAKYSDHLIKINDFLTTVGYAVSAGALGKLAEYTIDQLGKPFPESTADKILNNFTKINGKSYCVYPPLLTQLPGRSTLRNAERNYVSLIDKNWKKYVG